MEQERLQEKTEKIREERILEIKRLEYELSQTHSGTVTVRRYWNEVMDDMGKEYRKQRSNA